QLERLYWQLSSYSNRERSDFKDWNKFTIAAQLWQDGLRLISEDMVQKVNNAHAYLKKMGFKLKGIKADGNCFFNAFLESYQLLSRKIPLLDMEGNKTSYLRKQVAAQYENIPNASKYPDRSEQIKKDTEWVTAAGEGDLLANIFDLPIRVLTVETEGVMDMLTFSQYNKDREEWNKIHETDRPSEYIFIVDLGGHFIHAVPDFSAEPQYSSLDRKEQYRLNIVSSIIQWALQERIYRASKNDSAHLILASRLLKQIGWLAKYQLKPEDFTKKLGDCLFDNIIAQLPSSTITSQELRESVVQFMREHSEGYSEEPDYDDNELRVSDGEDVLFFENWEQYLTQMSKSQVWATELEIQATAFKMDCSIVVLAVEDKPKIYNPESPNNPLFLLHVNNNHFKACTPLEGSILGEIYNAIKYQDHY
ncbi:MAG: hypothetical protein ACRDFB_08355, partial [Rhabdochlamydiaceae bacterium]